MNFLIQGDPETGLPEYDFGFELIKAIEFQEEHMDIDRGFAISDGIVSNLGWNTEFHYTDWCPVGSVEFIHRRFNSHGIPIPAPVNIPTELYELSGLRPRIVGHCTEFSKRRFIKHADIIKHESNGPAHWTPSSDGRWQVTDLVDIISEWRCFVHHGKLVDVKHYSGDWGTSPSESFIDSAIREWKSAPIAYTLDVGTGYAKERFRNFIIEAHNFYSCGLYGFSARNVYPQMLAQWYREHLEKTGVIQIQAREGSCKS